MYVNEPVEYLFQTHFIGSQIHRLHTVLLCFCILNIEPLNQLQTCCVYNAAGVQLAAEVYNSGDVFNIP